MKTRKEHFACWFLGIAVLMAPANADESRALKRIGQSAGTLKTRPENSDSRKPTHSIATLELPPLPDGVMDLKFSEFYRTPVGPRGLEFTDKLRHAAGKKVRVLGFMVRQERPTPHSFLLASVPITLHEDEYGFCEDMPAAVLHVHTDSSTPAKVPFTPGLLLLTGRLDLGNRAESSGRVSTVRLYLDPPTSEQRVAMNHAISSVSRPLTNAVAPAETHAH